MKFLITATGSAVTIYSIAPLATAVRNAGHEILLATNEPLMEAAEVMGIPAVSITPEPIRHFLAAAGSEHAQAGPEGRREQMLDTGRGLARMASACLPELLDTAEAWRPDLSIGTSMSYAAGLLATRFKIPYVRYAEYLRIPMADIDPGAEQGLRPELKRLGLGGLPDPDVFFDVTPPSLLPPGGPRPMRFIPANPQRRLEHWMYARPEGRPRVLITSGTHHRMLSDDSLRQLVDDLTRLEADVLIAAPARTAEALRPELGHVRIGWIPLDVVAPTCDLAVNHGGATTAMTFMAAGVPQVITPPNIHTKAIAQALSGFGSAVTLPPGHEPGGGSAEVVAANCREILAGSGHTRQAQALAQEIGTLPAPAEIVHRLETLAAA